jgi:cold-inducible RNA-binding protein
MQNKIYVGNLSYSLDEAGLRDVFKDFGEITDLTVPKDRVTGRSRGFAFVTFAEASHAEASLQMDGKEVSGRKIVVKFAERKSEGGGGGGGKRHHSSHRDERSERW